MWPLRGRVVLVTGASSGIGRATALAVARHGAHVCLAARREDRLYALAAEIRRLGSAAHVFPVDLADHAAATWLVGAVVVRLGRIDVLVNNAGYGLYGAAEVTHPDDVERLFAVNVLSPLAAMRVAIPAMQKQREGHIVNVASLAAARGIPHLGAYAATKAALVRASEAARVEVRGTGVHVSVVSPGPVATEFGEAAVVTGPAPWFSGISNRFAVSPERVAGAILRCVRTGAADVTVPWWGSLAFLLAQAAPASIADAVIGLMPRLARGTARSRRPEWPGPHPPPPAAGSRSSPPVPRADTPALRAREGT